MKKLKEALIKFTNSNPTLFPNNNYSELIEQQFSKIFHDFVTTPPNHPPYAAMIHKAIWELNEKGGSSEDSISNYIKEEYVDLPWAHSSLLKHHLEKLCDGKEICMTHKQRYRPAGAADSDPVSTPESDSSLKRKQNSKPVEKIRKKHKKLKCGQDSELRKTSSRHHKKHKKNKKCLDSESGETSGRHHKKHKKKKKCLMVIHKKSKQIVDVFQEQGQVVQPLDEMADEHKNIMGDGSHEQQICRFEDQTNEQEKSRIDEGGISKGEKKRRGRKRKLMFTSIDNCGKHSKKYEETQLQVLNEANVKQHNGVPDSESHEKNHTGRRWTRSQQKTLVQKYEMAISNGKLDVVEYVPEEKQYSMEIFEVEQTPSPLSTAKMNGQRSKLRSSQKNTDLDELALSEAQDLSTSQQDQHPDELENQPKEDKPKHRGRGRPRKPRGPEKIEVLSEPASSQKNTDLEEPTLTEAQGVTSSQQDQQPDELEDKPERKRRGRPRKRRDPEKTQVLYETASSQKNTDFEEATLTEALGASRSQQDQKPDELASEEKQNSMQIIEVEQTPSALSDEPTSTEAQDARSQQDQQLDELKHQPKEDKPKHKRCGRPRKHREPEKTEVLYETASSPKNKDIEEATLTEVLVASSSQQDQKPDELASEEKQQSTEIIEAKQTPSPLSTSEMNGQQAKPRSSQNTDLDEPTLTVVQDANSSQQDQQPDELASEEKEQSMEIIEAEQTPSPLSTSEMNGQQAKLRSSQNTDLDEPTLTEARDASSSRQDQQPDELASEEKEQSMEIIKAEQTPSLLSTSEMNGQRAKLSSQNTYLDEPTLTEAQDTSSSQQYQQPDGLVSAEKEQSMEIIEVEQTPRSLSTRKLSGNKDLDDPSLTEAVDASSFQQDQQPDELASEEKEQSMEIFQVEQTPSPISTTEINGQRVKLRNFLKNTNLDEPTSAEELDPSSSQKDQQRDELDDQSKVNKSNHNGCGEVFSETRSSAITKQSKKSTFENRQVDEASRKFKSTNKKSQLNYGLHKMTRRSGERNLRDQSY